MRAPRFAFGSVLVVLLLVLTGSGAAWGYDRANETVLPAGTTIAGMHLGNLSVEEATSRLHEALIEPLHRPLRLTADDVAHQTTPWDLGLRADPAEAVRAALSDHRSANLFQRTWRAIAALGPVHPLEPELEPDILRATIADLAARVGRDPSDAALEQVDGWLHLRHAVAGRHLDLEAAERVVTESLAYGALEVALPVAMVDPAVPTSAFHRAVLIHTGSNRLYLYEDGEIVRDYPVASGKRGYSTPTGSFEITAKRRNPTWGNPGSAWARNMPRFIGPGPNNPLGTRALNINSPGIRIHGTPDRASIGRHASHGCVRMLREHVEELFELVELATPVVIVRR